MNQAIDVSVIMPTYRRPEYLAEALQKILEVKGLSIEVLVIDDSPDAEGQAVVSALGDERVKYSRRAVPSNGHPALLRNDAARMASGSVFYFLDDDDLVIPESLTAAYQMLCNGPHGVLVTLPRPFGGSAAKVESETAFFEGARTLLQRRPSAFELEARLTFKSSFIVPSACLVKRNVFEKVGGFDEEIALCEDVDFFAKAIAVNGYVLGDMTIVERRIGHSSLMSEAKTDALRRSYIRLRQGFLARHGVLAYCVSRVKCRLSGLSPREEFRRFIVVHSGKVGPARAARQQQTGWRPPTEGEPSNSRRSSPRL